MDLLTSPIERLRTYKNLRYAVIFNPKIGIRCGYVELPDDIALSHESIDVIQESLNFDQELTFKGQHHALPFSELTVGWDHGHFGEGYDEDSIREYNANADTILQYLGPNEFPFATCDQVEEECKNFIDLFLNYVYIGF